MELTRQNYFSREAENLYMGSSSFKAWDILHGGCEAKQVAIKKGEWIEKENPAFLLGSYVHAWSSGDLQEFMSTTPQLFKKNSSELLAKYALGDEMINVLRNDPLVEKIREGAKEQIFTGAIAGVDFKIQVDILNLEKGYFADIKTTKNLQESYWNKEIRGQETFINKYDYYTQIAIYAEILKQNIGLVDYLEPYLIVVDKQEVPDHEVIYMGKNFISDKLAEIENRLSHITEVRKGLIEPMYCGKCDYCRSVKKIIKPISLSEYELELGIY
ncbi:PD-(D/E)XK nuclease-like domain-containing protein [Clostridium sp. FP1]|uniref:PD-(D/E)XK nuclease-like domain-containing protein n=1 Tax=Clostridium sp. FP1 TaxID=2724076 RepID=UPI001CCB721D|nr:PD-(D/E)XK nuclease-like domain-containing protein [Clostridium sp. FP1]MBZ9633162.1 PD-(D/E)XK nuclease-like domain-containing protein [Clostridium sp. FP1]